MALSPMMKQYLATKEQYNDSILFYRLGDFYEMFFDDAITASDALGLVLTGRDCGLDSKAPMCGVPFHAADSYIAKLVGKGYKVAVCEQTSQPVAGKLVTRDVSRVVSAGTLMDSENSLQGNCSNFLACVYENDNVIACTVCDISCGLFYTTQFDGDDVVAQLQEFLVAYKPAEIIANSVAMQLNGLIDAVRANYVPKFTSFDDRNFDKKDANALLQKQLKVATLDGLGLRGKSHAVTCSGALINYLKQTQKRDLTHINKLQYISNSNFMSIDVKTRKNLELIVSANDNRKQGSLLWLLDKTVTSMGARLLAQWIDLPLQSSSAINYRLDGVEDLYRSFVTRDNLVDSLKKVKDIERLVGRLSYNTLTPKDCLSLRESLKAIPEIKHYVSNLKSKIIGDIDKNLQPLPEVTDLIDKAIDEKNTPDAIKDGNIFKLGYNAELDELILLSKNGKKLISDLEMQERQRTGIKTLKLGFNKVFGYYFDVTNSYKDSVPSDYIRKQTTVNSERYINQELKELEEKVLNADTNRTALELKLYDQLRNILLTEVIAMQTIAHSVATLDCLLAFARISTSNDYVRPTINGKNTALSIVGGRHPIVEQYIKRENFICNDSIMDTEANRMLVITGPNMSGKSTYMRQVALITLMAHIGCFVPATQATIPLVDKLFTRIGANDDLSFNQSTFMVEMIEVANIVNNATEKSLIILDEVGRGTSTFDGLSIAWALVEHVNNDIKAKTLFATHYHELSELEGKMEGIKNYSVAVKEHGDSVVFLHKIVRGSANKSFGIEVAKLAGVPNSICARAKQIADMLEDSDVNIKIDDLSRTKETIKATNKAVEIYNIIKDVDIDRCSPLEAFDLLNNLVKKVK